MGIGLEELKSFLAIGCNKNAISEGLQHFLSGIAKRIVIFGQQDGFRAPGRLVVTECLARFVIPTGDGEVDQKGGSLSQFAFREDVAAVLFHNAVYGGQAESGSFAGFLGGEKGLKDVLDGCRVHAHAGVGNREQNITPGGNKSAVAGEVRSYFNVLSFNDEPSTADHGIPGIQAEIQDHLLELRGIHEGNFEVLRSKNLDVDIGSDDPAEEIHFFLD